MQNLDFLPNRYRERKVVRRSHVWRGFVVMLFGAAVAAAAICQSWLYAQAQDSLAEVEAPYARAQAQTARLSQLQKELAELRAKAMLQVFLRRCWPRTQVLHHALKSLPESIKLIDLAVAEEGKPRRTDPPARALGVRPNSEQQASLPPTLADLQSLQEQREARQTVVSLSGITYETTDLHTYVAAVNGSPLIAKAELVSLEQVASGADASATRFRLRLLIESDAGQ